MIAPVPASFWPPARRLLRGGGPALLLGGLIAALCGCPTVGDADRLFVSGQLEREGVEKTDTAAVDVDYLSERSRGEWWPCDARVTAQACVGEHHVNVYLAKPQVTDIGDIGRAYFVVDGVPDGVFEAFDSVGADSFEIGTELNAFVIVASDAKGEVGAELTDDEETTAASRVVSGTLNVIQFGGLDGRLQFTLSGETGEGNSVRVEFGGPMSNPGTIPNLEGPETCVADALVR